LSFLKLLSYAETAPARDVTVHDNAGHSLVRGMGQLGRDQAETDGARETIGAEVGRWTPALGSWHEVDGHDGLVRPVGRRAQGDRWRVTVSAGEQNTLGEATPRAPRDPVPGPGT
jgi:hypothetical protein